MRGAQEKEARETREKNISGSTTFSSNLVIKTMHAKKAFLHRSESFNKRSLSSESKASDKDASISALASSAAAAASAGAITLLPSADSEHLVQSGKDKEKMAQGKDSNISRADRMRFIMGDESAIETEPAGVDQPALPAAKELVPRPPKAATPSNSGSSGSARHLRRPGVALATSKVLPYATLLPSLLLLVMRDTCWLHERIECACDAPDRCWWESGSRDRQVPEQNQQRLPQKRIPTRKTVTRFSPGACCPPTTQLLHELYVI